jgi:hypothetical protein
LFTRIFAISGDFVQPKMLRPPAGVPEPMPMVQRQVTALLAEMPGFDSGAKARRGIGCNQLERHAFVPAPCAGKPPKYAQSERKTH